MDLENGHREQRTSRNASSRKLDVFREKIRENKWDVDSWRSILSEIQSKGVAIARPFYEEFLAVFPTSGRHWKMYVEHEMREKNYVRAEDIFRRCLKQCLNVDLWKCYLRYLVDHCGADSGDPSVRMEITNAFETALAAVGMDITSTPIWQDYIRFVKTAKVNGKMEESQRMETLRKLYQRAVVQPMNNIEGIWKEYDSFENNLNKTLAKALLTEHGPKYMQARSIYLKKKRFFEGIQRKSLATLPSPADEPQVALWKKLIAYERTNPQNTTPQRLRAQVTFTYNQCLLCLYRYPEIWYEAAQYQLADNHLEEAINFYKRGIKAMESSFFLHFAFANCLEMNGMFKEAQGVYEGILTSHEVSHQQLLIRQQLEQHQQQQHEEDLEDKQQKQKEIQSQEQPQEQQQPQQPQQTELKQEGTGEGNVNNADNQNKDEMIVDEEYQTNEGREEELLEEGGQSGREGGERGGQRAGSRGGKSSGDSGGTDEGSKSLSLVYIEYMRFVRRAFGFGEARKVFYRARHSPATTYHIYIAAAEMEYKLNKSKEIALKIYELGFKKYSLSIPFVVQYANFLINLDDEMNTRVLLEKILSLIPSSQTKEIWNTYKKFEIQCGTLHSQQIVSQRYRTLFPSADPNGILTLVQRYSFMDLWPCSQEEVSSFEGGHCMKMLEEAQEETGAGAEETIAKNKSKASAATRKIWRDKFVKPDLSKMVLFNPDQILNIYTLPSGETVTLPAILGQLLNTLPSPDSHYEGDGLAVDVDQLMQMIMESEVKLPETTTSAPNNKRKLDDAKRGADIYRDRQAAKQQKVKHEG